MRCLWITRQDPRPADSGELIYTRGLLTSLAARPGMEITVLAHGTAQPCHGAPPVTWELHGAIPTDRVRSLASPLPADAFRLGNAVQRAALARLLGQDWDWVIIDQAACAWSLDLLGKYRRVAYLAHNHEASVRRQVAAGGGSSFALRMALQWDASKYARMERDLCQRADLITTLTPRDAAAFLADNPGKPVCILPPGYHGEIPAGPPRELTEATPRTVVLSGAFEWIAKRRNLESFLRAAAGPFQRAGVGFRVVGKADPAWFEALAKRYPWASFHPNVPSVTPHLDQARIGLIPEALGGGFKLKALDYIFRGLPVAAIDAALSGVPVDPATGAITAGDPASLATAVVARIDDLGFLNHAARQALEACRHAFHWEDRGITLARALENPDACRS